jgi:2-polyprenyl-3-methyl-5-hydroxy-6-metoxy-1,4-benzoquinol methylase
MNWARLRPVPWLDTRANFVASVPPQAALLDLGSSDGETLGHIAELRPDLRLFAVDLDGSPDRYPARSQYQQANLETDRLRWPDASMDAITCMHLVEHLQEIDWLLQESARLLKPGARMYIETPHLKSLSLPSLKGAPVSFTLNFYDDPTHVRLVDLDTLARAVHNAGLEVVASGISRNWLFAASYPILFLLPASRQKYTARIHWLGWSAYLIAARP